VAISTKEPVAAPSTKQEADVVTQDRRQRSDRDHDRDVEAVRGARIEGGGNQRRLAGQRHPHAFQADEQEQGCVAVGIDQVAERDAKECEHGLAR
jgi:hypothetical protein